MAQENNVNKDNTPHYHLLIMGAPGAGKGTVSELLTKHLPIEHISMGDILREHIAAHDALGKKIEEPIKEGKFIPNEITESIMKEKIASLETEGKGFLLDGFPRNEEQAEFVVTLTNFDAVIKVVLDDETIIERLSGRRVCPKCGASYHLKLHPPKQEGICDDCGTQLIQREDDTPETIRDRLQLYHKEIEVVFQVLKENNISFIEVPGSFDMEKEGPAIVEKIVKGIEGQSS